MLQLKLSKVSFSADGTQLVVQDTTGAYNSVTNPTGYGAPNRAISTNLILRWKLFNSPKWFVLPDVSGAVLASGYTIDTVKLGQTSDPQLLPDGVEFVQYLGLYSKGNTVAVTPGSNKIDISNFTLSDFDGINYIALNSDQTIIYKVLSRTATTLTLDQCYEGSNATEIIFDAQNGDLYELVQTYTAYQLDKMVAATSAEHMYGKQQEILFKKMMRLFIAQARFEKTDYYGADLIMQNLYTECFRRRFHDTY